MGVFPSADVSASSTLRTARGQVCTKVHAGEVSITSGSQNDCANRKIAL